MCLSESPSDLEQDPMKPCRYLPAGKYNKLGAFFVYPITSVLVIFFEGNLIWIMIQKFWVDGISDWLGCLLLLTCALLWLKLLRFMIEITSQSLLLECRRFLITREGLYHGFRFGRVKFTSWTEVKEVAVSGFEASASRHRFQTVICVFLQDREESFVDGILHYPYGAKHIDQFVMMDYTQEIYDRLSSVYDREIMDFREKQRCVWI